MVTIPLFPTRTKLALAPFSAAFLTSSPRRAANVSIAPRSASRDGSR
jgi:hypothetical protein